MAEKVCEEKKIYRYSAALKHQIVKEVESGIMSVREAQMHYDIKHRRTINAWVSKYGERQLKTRVVRVIMKNEQERIRDLEKALADEKLRNMLYAAQLESYAKRVPDIKKKLSTRQLKKFEENEKKLEGMG